MTRWNLVVGGGQSPSEAGWSLPASTECPQTCRKVAIFREASAIQGSTVQCEFGSIWWWEYWRRFRKAIVVIYFVYLLFICGGIFIVVRWETTTLLEDDIDKSTWFLCVVGVYFSPEADLKRPLWFLTGGRDGGCSSVHSGTAASSWNTVTWVCTTDAGSNAIRESFPLVLAVLHQRVGGIYSTQHLFDGLLQPQHYRCFLPQAASPSHIQHSQFSQGERLPRDRIQSKLLNMHDYKTYSSTQQSKQRLPNLAFWTKEGVCGDTGVWLHRAQVQQRHQDWIRHI